MIVQIDISDDTIKQEDIENKNSKTINFSVIVLIILYFIK